MISHGFEQGLAGAHSAALGTAFVHWAERAARMLSWIFWMLTPIPPELGEPALRQFADLRARAWHLLSRN